jgi:hypothetical protein
MVKVTVSGAACVPDGAARTASLARTVHLLAPPAPQQLEGMLAEAGSLCMSTRCAEAGTVSSLQ